MNRRLGSAVLVLALHATVVRAEEVWVWTDSSGEAHYTNDLGSIPEKARRTARQLGGENPLAVEPRTARTKPAESTPPAKAAEGEGAKESRGAGEAQPPPPEPIETAAVQAPREDEQVSEEQWRALFRKANDRVRRTERKAQRTREALSKLPGQDVTTYDVAGNVVVESRWQSLRVQLEEDEYQLETAREQLHDLERAAAREAIPLEWRR